MSRNEWEEGSVKVPANQWASFRAAIIGAYNREQEKEFRLAQEAYRAAQAAGKGKRGFDRAAWLRNESRFWDVAYKITRHGNRKIFVPKKGDFKLLPLTRSAVMQMGEVIIRLDNSKKALTYSSGENNHAVDDAHRDPVVTAMFRALSNVKFTPRTGGQFIGNDEYNQDARDAGGGGNYVTSTFGTEKRMRERFRGGRY